MKRFVSIFISFLFLVIALGLNIPVARADDTLCDGCTITDPNVEEAFTKGSGTADDPWQVGNKKQLNHIRQHLDGHFIQMVDLDFRENDLNGTGDNGNFDPIGGNQQHEVYLHHFETAPNLSGSYNGNGKKISGLRINVAENYYIGLFGIIGTSGKVSNLTIENSSVHGYYYNGNICGVNQGTIENCINKSIVNGKACTGGLAGFNGKTGKILKCKNMSDVTSDSADTGFRVGGICGLNFGGEINNCENTGCLNMTDGEEIGGITCKNETDGLIVNCTNLGNITNTTKVGSVHLSCSGITNYNFGTIDHCHNIGDVSGVSLIGGIVGQNSGPIINCDNSGSITGTIGYVAGIAAEGFGEIHNCINSGSITGYSSVGGISGDIAEPITCSYNCGNITGNSEVGGIAGQNRGVVIQDCFNSATVTGWGNVGGIVGLMYSDATVKNTYNSGQVITNKVAPVANGSVINSYYLNSGYTVLLPDQARSRYELTQQSTYAGWDFDNTWAIIASENNSYPILRSLHTPITENNDLWSISIDGQEIAGFKPSETAYQLNVPYETQSILVEATQLYGGHKVSGTGNISLNQGQNEINITVYSQDESSQKMYHLYITRLEKAPLERAPGIYIDGVQTTPAFNHNLYQYSARAPYTISSVIIEFVKESAGQTISGCGQKKLRTGNNTFYIKTTDISKKTVKYKVVIYREYASKNNKLSALNIDGKLIPGFSPGKTSYTLRVPYDKTSIDIAAQVQDAKAKILSGTGSFTIKYGTNKFKVAVKAQNGSKRTIYIKIIKAYPPTYGKLSGITVSEGSLSPAFSPDTYRYRLALDAGTSSVVVNATKFHKENRMTGVPKRVSVRTGKSITVRIYVYAPAGRKTYTITITRAKE